MSEVPGPEVPRAAFEVAREMLNTVEKVADQAVHQVAEGRLVADARVQLERHDPAEALRPSAADGFGPAQPGPWPYERAADGYAAPWSETSPGSTPGADNGARDGEQRP